jgi:cellulose synthase A
MYLLSSGWFRINFCLDVELSAFDVCVTVQPRPMVPKKDIAVYGYGSVAWKDRMEDWKKRQNDRLQVVKHEGDDGGNFGGNELDDDPDLPM